MNKDFRVNCEIVKKHTLSVLDIHFREENSYVLSVLPRGSICHACSSMSDREKNNEIDRVNLIVSQMNHDSNGNKNLFYIIQG